MTTESNLTTKGLEYIRNHKEELTRFAQNLIIWSSSQDWWEDYDTTRGCSADNESRIEDCVDINIWLDETTEDWRASAYPMEINSIGEVQTSTQDFVELF